MAQDNHADSEHQGRTLRRKCVDDVLPNEMLLEIFKYHLVAWGEAGSISCLRLAAVCRRWRDLCLATPELWRIIVVSKETHIDWLKFAMKQSSPAPLDLRYSDSRQAEAALITATSQLNRVQTLSIAFGKRAGFYGYEDSLASGLLNRHMQALEGLHVSFDLSHVRAVDPRDLEEDDFPEFGIAPAQFPSLRSLSIFQVRFRWMPYGLSSSLQSLHMVECNLWDVSDTPLSRVLDALRVCKELRSLKLVNAFLSFKTLRGGETLRTVAFPRLQSFVLSELSGDVYNFLSHLELSPEVACKIDTSSGLPLEMLGNKPCGLFTSIPRNPCSLPMLLLASRAIIALKRISVSPASSQASLTITSRHFSSDKPLELHILEEFIDLFSLSPLEHLEISTPMDIPVDIWTRTFNAFPRIAHLNVCQGGEMETLLQALATSPIQDPGSSTPEQLSGKPILPCLRSLTFTGMESTASKRISRLQSLRDCLRARERLDAPKLESVIFQWQLLEAGDDGQDVRELVRDMRRLVGEVSLV